MAAEEMASSSSWTWDQDKAFENSLAVIPEDCKDRWEQIAAAVPGKFIEDIKQHYQLLVQDIESIESGCVPLPNYVGEDANDCGSTKKTHTDSQHGGKGSRSEQERRKGIAWTEEEHRQFLLGLERYGKGDWRSISRNFVVTRTPTQVASHAQKYFIRLNSMNKDRRRSSIHDITSVGDGDASAPQGPITGQSSATAPTPGKSSKHSPQATTAPSGVGIYGTTIGQPVGGNLVPAVCAPVTLPVSATSHISYGVRAPVSGATVPGAPVIIPPMNYPMPPNASAPR